MKENFDCNRRSIFKAKKCGKVEWKAVGIHVYRETLKMSFYKESSNETLTKSKQFKQN